jgi:hypothetical protein
MARPAETALGQGPRDEGGVRRAGRRAWAESTVPARTWHTAHDTALAGRAGVGLAFGRLRGAWQLRQKAMGSTA